MGGATHSDHDGRSYPFPPLVAEKANILHSMSVAGETVVGTPGGVNSGKWEAIKKLKEAKRKKSMVRRKAKATRAYNKVLSAVKVKNRVGA